MNTTLRIALLPVATIAAFAAQAEGLRADHPGRAVYEQYCHACHNVPATRAPALSALQEMSAQTLKFTLTEGVMQAQGSLVPKERFADLIGYLAAAEPAGGDWVAAMMCKPDQRTVDLDQPVSLSMFGVDINNSRFMPAKQAGLSTADMKSLELAWAIGFPKTTSLRASPVIVG
jgi:polyvinyl alcohol dehydrogenase (cytochrome)